MIEGDRRMMVEAAEQNVTIKTPEPRQVGGTSAAEGFRIEV
jgi:hypothetical protein